MPVTEILTTVPNAHRREFGRLPSAIASLPIVLWAALRVLTSWVAVSTSSARPLNEVESTIPVWPPSSPAAGWIDRVLASPWNRWDVPHYARIVAQGYRPDDGSAQFHPLFPCSAAIVAQAGIAPVLSLLAVSTIVSLLLVLAFRRLARLDLDARGASESTLSLLSFPAAFSLFAPYPEGMFLFFSVLCLLSARRGRWWVGGLAGGLATLTRQQGLLLMLPLVWEFWESHQRSCRKSVRDWRSWAAIGLMPAAMLLWIAYRGVFLSDLNPEARNFNALVYSVLISPSASRVVPVQAFLWPWQALWLAFAKFWTAPDVDQFVDLTLLSYFIFLMAVAWRSMRPSYRLYSLAVALVSMSYHTGPLHSYMGLPRHLLVAFPVFVGLGAIRSRYRTVLIWTGSAGVLFLTFLYTAEAWVP